MDVYVISIASIFAGGPGLSAKNKAQNRAQIFKRVRVKFHSIYLSIKKLEGTFGNLL